MTSIAIASFQNTNGRSFLAPKFFVTVFLVLPSLMVRSRSGCRRR